MDPGIRRRVRKSKAARAVMIALLCFCNLLLVVMIAGLFLRSLPILKSEPLSELLFSTSWRPLKGEFGLLPFLMGTLWVTAVANAVAVPPCLLTAIYLSEYARQRTRELIKPFIDLLAGIPSVVYGVWGVLVVVPLVRDHVAPRFDTFSSGYSTLAAGLVLAVMVFPTLIGVSLEVFETVPYEAREASLALGATRWQTVKFVVLRKAAAGVLAAVVLGVSRAFGETMAVLMVAGNVARIPHSVLDPSYPLPALIANNYGEMLSIPLYDAAILLSSLLLLLLVFAFNLASRVILIQVERRAR
ncbi:MAG: phosphate ABC transporter permease subunit PstC [Pseudomonadota bacterium]